MVQENCLNYDSIIILGPTASGKTSLSITLAKKLNTEIVNADSMYIYKDLNIGTAKPTKIEMDNIIHHLIDFVDADKTYNVSQYRSDASRVILSITGRGFVPIIVGGTGLYMYSLINNYSYGETIKNDTIRNELELLLEKSGKDYLYDELKKIDPETASKLHPNDTKRVIRALEIYRSSGSLKSDIQNTSDPVLKNPLIIGLNCDRNYLYERIDARVDIMIQNGLIDEVKKLYEEKKLNPETHQSMKGIGYKELVSYFRGEISLEEAIEKIKQHSRNYAKRQITWFKRNTNIHWFDPINDKDILNKIIDLINKKTLNN